VQPPKKPTPAFFFFLKKFVETSPQAGSITEAAKASGEAWKALSAEAKAVSKSYFLSLLLTSFWPYDSDSLIMHVFRG
jgi:hypothetical protein